MRASILAGLNEVPGYVRVAKDQDMLEMAIDKVTKRETDNNYKRF